MIMLGCVPAAGRRSIVGRPLGMAVLIAASIFAIDAQAQMAQAQMAQAQMAQAQMAQAQTAPVQDAPPSATGAARSKAAMPAATGGQPPGGKPAGTKSDGGKPQGGLGESLGGSSNSGPLNIDAVDGFEMQQENKVYIARGDVHATRGGVTVNSDTLYAYYRDTGNGKTTEIWRVVADGHVTIATATQTIYGEKAVYDLDQALIVVTGKNLRLVTPMDTVTARDSLEWYDGKQIAVARGDAIAIRADRRIKGDVLTADVVSGAGQPSRISRVDAKGHVLVSNTQTIGTGDSGVYNVDSGIATLAGHVKLARGENVMQGDNGVVDLNTNISRLLGPPGSAAGAPSTRVQGYIVPQQKGQTQPANPR
jgi:lipopolysaccharide export system protein LptA